MAKKLTAPPPPTTAPTLQRSGAVKATPALVEMVATDTGPPLPRIPASHPFLLAWNPSNWHVMGGKLIPRLRKVRLQPGVNRVEKSKDGRWKTGALRTHLEERGWSILPYDRGPDGSYMVQVDCEPVRGMRATAYLETWASAYPGSDQIGSDPTAYAEWCAALVEDGTIPACPPYIADRLADQYQTTLSRYQEEIGRGNSTLAAHAKALEANIAVLTAYLEADRAPVRTKSATVDLGE